jgi:hypothetical protein
MELHAGLVELEFRSGARVVIESPAVFSLVNGNEMTLVSGKLMAHVPARAAGFTVQTSSGAVVDLGTRFGVNADPKMAPEVHVLEGRVEVQSTGQERLLTRGQAVAFPDSGNSSFTPRSFSPEQFPTPGRTFGSLLVGGGFEDDSLVAIDYAPRQFGLWSGDPALVVPDSENIRPRTGNQMLRFEIPDSGKPVISEQWQIVDLHEIRKAAAGARMTASFSAWFNRALRASAHPNFGVTVAAFKGDPAQAPHFWAARREKALALAENYIQSDTNPATWERAEAHIAVPPDADFLLVEIAANSPVADETVSSGPNGHYADDATLEVHVAPIAATANSVVGR